MYDYEIVQEDARARGLNVKEKYLRGRDGLIKGNRVAIRRDLRTSVEKSCSLVEEVGHHETSVGNILDMGKTHNCKQERQARFWGYNKKVGLRGIIKAFEAGCQSRYEMAEYLNVTEGFLQECIECYRDKYGVSKEVDNYYIMFIPYLMVGKII